MKTYKANQPVKLFKADKTDIACKADKTDIACKADKTVIACKADKTHLRMILREYQEAQHIRLIVNFLIKNLFISSLS